MKKILLISALALSLLLTACGAAPAPQPTEAPTETETPAPTAPAVTEGMVMLLIREGGMAAADLNGDGTAEQVRYLASADGAEHSLTINGMEYWEKLLELGYPAYYPSDSYFAVVDIDGADGMLEIAVMDYGPSDDYTTHFFRYDGASISYLGYLDGLVYGERGLTNPITFNGDGTGKRQIRYGVLQTWFGSTGWKFTEGEGFSEVRSDIYDAYDDGLTALVDVVSYAENDPDSERGVIPAGTSLAITGTDNDQWVRVFVYTNEYEGYAAWLRLDEEYGQQVETVNGYDYSGAVLQGLVFAD